MSRDISRAVDSVWRIEGARIVASLAKVTGDVGLAEDLAQEAVVEALQQWSRDGVPRNPGAWLTTVAKRRAIDEWRRRAALEERYRSMAQDLPDSGDLVWEPIDDDVLRLVFTACHPALSREAQIALTLRVVSGLSTREIARLLLVPVATAQARITRAKKTLAAAGASVQTPEPAEWKQRLAAVLDVIYLLFTEGYAATEGPSWMRADLANEALRLGRVLRALTPREADVHALLALMEFQASRFAARRSKDGSAVLLADQNRSRWDRAQILRGSQALAAADALSSSRGSYALQAAIAQCHAVAPSVEKTNWEQIVSLYEELGAIAPNPIVELNRAVAVSMAAGPDTALGLVDGLADNPGLRGSYLLPSVRGELLAQLGRVAEARAELLSASRLTANAQQRAALQAKAAALT